MTLRHVLLTACSRLKGDDKGALAPAFALLSIPVVFMVGMGADYGNKARTETQVQAAVDTAVLAAARLNDADANRAAIAKRYFEAQLSTEQLSMIRRSEFSMTNDLSKVTGDVELAVPARFGGLLGATALMAAAKATAAIARPDIRQLDIVMCIDATGSMTPTLNAVKTNALNLERNLNDELVKRGIPAFDAMRVRAIYYRDYGGTYLSGANTSFYYATSSGTAYINLRSSNPDYWKYVGDQPPMKWSSFFNLPAQRADFQNYVNPETAWGGGDLPEAGLECVNEAMDSAWAKVGDVPAGSTKALQAVYPLIAVWTDAAAHKPSYSLSLKNPSYPAATKMPRTYDTLRAKWDNSAVIDQARKMLVFFGNPDLNSNDRDGVADGWKQVKLWPGFIQGGTLTEGNANLVTKLADAIASRVRAPTLTQ
ncbi:TadE/TadG family type IV pilus assembly protein [Alsobacter sp. R-9]